MGIGDWLGSVGLHAYTDLFESHRIGLDVLPDLTEDDLKELGLPLGDRKRLLKAVARLPRAPPAEDSATEPAQEAERRHLTVMFCDLVGSTDLSGRLDPEDLRGVLQGFQDVCGAAVERYGGHIAKYIGDGILVYFGYPQAHEDDPRRALQAGLDMVGEISRLDVRHGGGASSPIAVRVGIHTGLVVVGEMGFGDIREAAAIVGETPNLAARLQSAAEPGSVVVSDVTRRLAGGFFTFNSLGALPLKGFSQPIKAWRVRGANDPHMRLEGGAGLAPVVGRDEEIGLILKRWRSAKAGERQLLLISGEAGIGKSRLIRAFRDRIEDEEHNRILYYGSPYHANSAFFPVIDQLHRALRSQRSDDADGKIRRLHAMLEELGLPAVEYAPALAMLLSPPPAGDGAPQGGDAAELRRRITDRLAGVVAAMASRRPVLMVIEDAHHVDPSTLDFVDLLVDGAGDMRLLVVAVFRREMEERWSRHPHATLVKLGRLSRPDTAAMVSQLLGGGDAAPELVEEIAARTDGIPLFVEELTRSMLESGVIAGDGGRFALSAEADATAIPSSLQDLLAARLDRLRPGRAIAQLAATLGRTFRHDLLAAISPLPAHELADGIEALICAGLLIRRDTGTSPEYTFRHALICDAAYQSVLKATRRRTHDRIAGVIHDDFPEIVESQPELVARHCTEAGRIGDAVTLWRQAGELAARRSANVEAANHFRTALQLLPMLPDDDDRRRREFALQVALGAALTMTLGVVAPEVEAAYARARELSRYAADPRERFNALWGYYFVFEIRARWKSALGNVRELSALAANSGDDAQVLQAHHAAWTANTISGRLNSGREHAARGIALYDRQRHAEHRFRYGGHDPGVCALGISAIAANLIGHSGEAARHCRDSLSLSDALGHPTSSMLARFFAAIVHLERCDYDGAASLAGETVAFAEQHGNIAFAKMGAVLTGRCAAKIDRGGEGIERMTRILAPARSKRRGGFLQSYYLGLLAEACLEANRLDEGIAALRDAFFISTSHNEHLWRAALWRLEGRFHLAGANDPAGARAAVCFERALRFARVQQARLLELKAAIELARLRAEAGRRDLAGQVLAPPLAWFEREGDHGACREARRLLDAIS